MINLTELVFFFKRYRRLVVLSFAAFVAILIIIVNWEAIIKALIPPKPPPGTVAFGMLPAYDISDGVKPKDKINFKLQTITGNFPSFPKNAKVFAVAKKIPSFAAEQSLKNKALRLRFNPEPIKIDGSIMEFASSDRVQKSLKGDTLTQRFILSFKIEPTLIVTKPRSVEGAQEVSHGFFGGMGLNRIQYPADKNIVKKLRFENNKIVEADSLSSAEMIEVDYYLTDFDKMPVVFINKGSSPVFALVANGEVVYAKKESPDIELFRFATYPLKGISQAWEELKAGKGYFNSENSSSTINVKDVKLGYVIGFRNNEYIQPAYLFLGEGDFIAFVPAVSDKWIEKTN